MAGLWPSASTTSAGGTAGIDEQMIEEIIESKIRRGVFNFFYALQQAFKNEDYDILNILVAGNSSKHPFVKKVFEEYTEKNQCNFGLIHYCRTAVPCRHNDVFLAHILV